MKLSTKISALFLIAIAAFLLSCNQQKAKEETTSSAINAEEPATAEQNKPADKNRLVGNWVRTDAPYQIKIAEVRDDGNLQAEYFNPKSIHVAKAMWNDEDGFFKVYVELRDENYPGSNYKLNYNGEIDALAGEYFQAVEGSTYEVAFTRAK